MNTRILICESQELIRESLAAILSTQPDFQVEGTYSTGHELLAAATKNCPDVVVLNVALVGLSGIEVTQRLMHLCTPARVIALTSHNNDAYVRAMLSAGAVGYLLISGKKEQLFEAIRIARRGKVHLCPEVRHVLQSQRRAAQAVPINGNHQFLVVHERRNHDRRRINIGRIACPLSQREKEVLQLIAEGKQAKEVAAMLGVSEPTVKSHRENIKTKLHVNSIAELTVYAVRIGLIHLGCLCLSAV
jgi:DNA-binding NarL/FixJ family response regulator